MSTEDAIQRGKGIISNPEFFMVFTLTALLGIGGLLTMLSASIDTETVRGQTAIVGPNIYAIAVIALVGILFAIAKFSGLGERFFVGLVALGGLFGGGLAITVVFWMIAIFPASLEYPSAIKWTIASIFAVGALVMPVAVIAGEKVLPLFIALVAGVWGVVSIIVFAMVVFQIGVD
jgi:hypothetical protein